VDQHSSELTPVAFLIFTLAQARQNNTLPKREEHLSGWVFFFFLKSTETETKMTGQNRNAAIILKYLDQLVGSNPKVGRGVSH